MSPLLDSIICSSSLASSPVEAHHPSPGGPIDFERAQKDRSRPTGNRKVFAGILSCYFPVGDVGFSRVLKTYGGMIATTWKNPSRSIKDHAR
ncbi:hypothetical protein ACS0PU_005452 [Formica fusca]